MPMKRTPQELVEERRRIVGWGQDYQRIVAEALPVFFEAVTQMYKGTLVDETALPAKTKALVYLALSCARAAPGTAKHIGHALEVGATRQEVIEAVALTQLTFGGQAVRHGIDALRELEADAPSEETGKKGV